MSSFLLPSLKETLARYRIPNWVFIFSTLRKCLLASMVSNKKSATHLIEDPFYDKLLFSWCFQDLSFAFVNGTTMCLSVDHSGFGGHGISLMCRLIFFCKFGKFSAIMSLYILSTSFFCSSPSGPLIMHMLVSLMVTHWSPEALFIFIVTLLLTLDHLYWATVKVPNSSANSYLLLCASNEFVISVIILLNSIWFFLSNF